MWKNTTLSLAVALGALASLPGEALAQPVSGVCSSGLGLQGYDDGYADQQRYLNRLWSRWGDCSRYDTFVASIADPVDINTTSPYLACRIKGIRAANAEVRRSISRECNRECVDAGIATGQSRALTFCGFFRRFAAPNLCSYATKQACQIAFSSTVTENCPEQFGTGDYYQSLQDACSGL